MEIFSEVIESLEAPWDLVLVSSNDFNQNNSRLRSWRKMMFNKKFALEKTYCIVGDVPQTIQNTYPRVSTLVTQPWVSRCIQTVVYKHAQPQILGKIKHIAKHAPGWDF